MGCLVGLGDATRAIHSDSTNRDNPNGAQAVFMKVWMCISTPSTLAGTQTAATNKIMDCDNLIFFHK